MGSGRNNKNQRKEDKISWNKTTMCVRMCCQSQPFYLFVWVLKVGQGYAWTKFVLCSNFVYFCVSLNELETHWIDVFLMIKIFNKSWLNLDFTFMLIKMHPLFHVQNFRFTLFILADIFFLVLVPQKVKGGNRKKLQKNTKFSRFLFMRGPLPDF